MDLTRAFNTVNHEILLQKQNAHGIKDLAHQWFTSYLSGRTQWIDIPGTLPDSQPVNTGVPERSILGPLLFITFMNGIETAVTESRLNLCADDTTMKTAMISKLSEASGLNCSVTSLSIWLNTDESLHAHGYMAEAAMVVQPTTSLKSNSAGQCSIPGNISQTPWCDSRYCALLGWAGQGCGRQDQ